VSEPAAELSPAAVGERVVHAACIDPDARWTGLDDRYYSAIDAIFVLERRFTRDVVGHDAREKAPTFNTDETDSREKLGQLTWGIEVPYRIRKVPNTLHALGRTPEKFCRKPYRETQIS
jgi:hypothetical protein